MKGLSKKLLKYAWIYEREDGDRGIVLAKTREEAVDKLINIYPDAIRRINIGDSNLDGTRMGWMYLYPIGDVYNGYGQGDNDIFIIEPA